MKSSDETVDGKGPEQEPRFREVLAALLRNKWIIIGGSLGLMLLAGLWTIQRPQRYEATTTVLINMNVGKQANPFEQQTEGTGSKLANEMAILKARGLAQKVVLDLLHTPAIDSTKTGVMPILLPEKTISGSDTNLADVETIIYRLQKVVTFVAEKESDVIRIVASTSEPHEASRIANAYADAYLEEVMQRSRSRSRSVREFLESRLTDQRGQLQRTEGALKQFMESSGVVSLDAESNRLVQELSQLEATRNGLSIEIEGVEKKLESMRAELPQQESSVANAVGQASDPYVKQLSEELARLEVQRDVTIAQNDPQVLNQAANQAKLKEINDQIAALSENLRKRTSDLIWGSSGIGTTGSQADPLDYLRTLRQRVLEAKIELETLRSRRTALNSIIAGYETKFRKIPQQNVELARVQRERLSTEKLYSLVEEKYNEAAIAEKSEFGYVDIVDRSSPEGAKEYSSLLIAMILGLLLGLAISTGVAFLLEALDVRVRTPQQLSRTGLAVLARIAVLDKELEMVEMEGAVPPEAAAFAPQLKLAFHPVSFAAECYRRLRTSLLRLQLERPIKVILVSSPNPQEGKSTTLLNLAISLAETRQKVLVVDTDLRRPTVHTLLGLDRSPGFTDVVNGERSIEKALHADVIPNLDVLTCGTEVIRPSSFFGNPEMIASVLSLRKKYAWVLMDAPPLQVVNDASVLASMVDGTLLVVEAGATRMEALEQAVVSLNDAGGKLLGVVLNRFDPKEAYGGHYGSTKYGHYDSGNAYYHQNMDEATKG
jgi:capsular exopolysaccharide synthesis family protein